MIFPVFENMRFLRIIVFLILTLWAVILTYLSLSVFHPRAAPEYDSFSKDIQTLLQRVNEGSRNLKATIDKLSFPEKGDPVPSSSLGSSHELLRNRAIRFAREIFFASSAGLTELQTILKDKNSVGAEVAIAALESLHMRIEEMTRYLEIDLDGLGRVDHLFEIRRRELDRLADVVQHRLDKLQNPPDCSKAKILHVSLTRPCAFGCNVHHLAYCFQMAYASGRTLVLTGTDSGYGEWWSRNFEPLSKTCPAVKYEDFHEIFFNEDPVSAPRIATCPYIAKVKKVEWLPPAIPEDLAPNLTRVHASPSVWFIGQLLTYLMRPKPDFGRLLNETLKSYGLATPHQVPVAGIHVRRTDKLNVEASFHALKEYMVYVERRFRFWDSQHQMLGRTQEWNADSQPHYKSTTPRQIFIATDDPSVFDDARREYPSYVFHGDISRAKSANFGDRLRTDSITGIALDIIVLSKVDYIVCTFSSQVCRISYELMQARHAELGDASGFVQSLDDLYYYGGQQAVLPEVIIGDNSTGLKVGQRIHIAGNHWNGYARVLNIPGHPDALLPAYKYQARILAVPMGSFND